MNTTQALKRAYPGRLTFGAALGLLLAGTAIVLGQPVITQQPQSCTNVAGSTATLTVLATGTQPLAYQWQRDSAVGSLHFYDLSDSTNETLVLTNVQASDAADYLVVVTNTDGAAISQVAQLCVAALPVITGQPSSFSVSLGANVTNRAAAAAVPAPGYQWCLNGAALAGQTNRTLILTNVQMANAGAYTVVVTNFAGAVTSRVATLEVDPTFTQITTGPLVTDMGSTAWGGWGDYDGDGYPDLFVARNSIGFSALYHNNGNGTFTTVTNAPWAKKTDSWNSGAWVDLDNDGRPDLVTLRYQEPPIVYFNNGDGTFSPVQLPASEANNIALIDLDRDGLVDLVLGGCFDWAYRGQPIVYRNNGDRTFTRLTSTNVGPLASFQATGVICADYDDDGAVDILCPKWGASGELLHNDGSGWFLPVTNTFPGWVVSGAWGDYDNDGRLDLCTVGFDDGYGDPGTTFLYHNLSGGLFAPANIGQTIKGHYFCASWADYDNDGFLDLLLVSPLRPGFTNALFHNNGDGTFAQIASGGIVNDLPRNSAGTVAALWFDYDNDGFLDLYLLNNKDGILYAPSVNTANFLYRNNGNSNAWLKVKLVGTASNRDAIGAKVRVQATYAGQTRWQRRDIMGGDAFNGNQLWAHFGLGDATNVDVLHIEWPSGTVQELYNVAIKQTLTVTEPAKLSMPQVGQLHIQCWQGMVYRIDASPNLAAWTAVATVTNLNLTGGITWTDPSVPGPSARFYRALKQ